MKITYAGLAIFFGFLGLVFLNLPLIIVACICFYLAVKHGDGGVDVTSTK